MGFPRLLMLQSPRNTVQLAVFAEDRTGLFEIKHDLRIHALSFQIDDPFIIADSRLISGFAACDDILNFT